MILDIHAHLTDRRYEGNISSVVNEFLLCGGGFIVDSGYSINSSQGAIKNTQKFDNVFATVGIHPEKPGEYSDVIEKQLKKWLVLDKCIALGEIGLDYHYDGYDKSLQKEVFERQICLASECGMPIVVHSRDASNDVFSVLNSNKDKLNCGFLMHCYSESKEMAKRYLDLGAYFSFGGVITFKNAKKDDIVRYIPKDRVLCETDSPYLAPHPLRGSINVPKNVAIVYKKMADIYGIDEKELMQIVCDNALSLFPKMK